LPVEYLSKCGTVNVLRCWTLWTCPAWKPGGKSSLIYNTTCTRGMRSKHCKL